MTEVLVVGGGPAGLAAALAAARTGREVTLIEASDRLGGMAASHEVAGQRVDLGSHRLHTNPSPRVDVLLAELLGDDLQERTRSGRLHVRDRWIGFPFSTTEMVRALGPRVGAAMARDLVSAPLRRPAADTYAEVVRAGLGSTALEMFHGPMAEKLWGARPEHLAGELARRRISVRTPLGVVRRMLRTGRPSGRIFGYPRCGYGQIVERLADAAVDAGVDIRLGGRVTRLDVRCSGEVGVDASLELAGASARIESTSVERVLWTAPANDLASAVPDAPDPRPVQHRAMVLVYAVVPHPHWQSFDAHYVPTPTVAFSRISEPKNYRDGPDPADRSVVCFEVPCSVEDEAWRRSPESWRAVLDEDVARIGLPPTAAAHVEVVRLPRVYPVIRPADVAARREFLDWSRSLEGVATFGRQALHVGDNLHHVLDMGLTAGGCWRRDGRWDDLAWTAALERFSGFVVED